MIIGYARVSTQDQNLQLQIDALQSAGCEMIFKEKVSGAKVKRPELERMLQMLRKDDEVVVFKLDRIGRSLRHLITIVEGFQEKGIKFKSLNDPVDTTTAAGKLVFTIFAALSEFERELIRERTKAGLQAARKRGRFGGRPKGLSKKAKVKMQAAKQYHKEGILTVTEILNVLAISKATYYKYLKYDESAK